jgi:hypothetical protein
VKPHFFYAHCDRAQELGARVARKRDKVSLIKATILSFTIRVKVYYVDKILVRDIGIAIMVVSCLRALRYIYKISRNLIL